MMPPEPPCYPVREFVILIKEFQVFEWWQVVGAFVMLYLWKWGIPFSRRKGGDP